MKGNERKSASGSEPSALPYLVLMPLVKTLAASSLAAERLDAASSREPLPTVRPHGRPDTETPGFAHENETKPPETVAMVPVLAWLHNCAARCIVSRHPAVVASDRVPPSGIAAAITGRRLSTRRKPPALSARSESAESDGAEGGAASPGAAQEPQPAFFLRADGFSLGPPRCLRRQRQQPRGHA